MPQLTVPEMAYLAGTIAAFVSFGVSLFSVWVYVNLGPERADFSVPARVEAQEELQPLRKAA